jgi:hypothetical protein
MVLETITGQAVASQQHINMTLLTDTNMCSIIERNEVE